MIILIIITVNPNYYEQGENERERQSETAEKFFLDTKYKKFLG